MKKGRGMLLLIFIAVVVLSIFMQQSNELQQPVNSLETVLQSIEGIGRVAIYLHDQETQQEFSFFQSMPERTSTKGILIVCEGANDLQVRKQLYQAIESVMDIPSHRIIILPMKKEETE